MGAEVRTDVRGIQSTHVRRFATEADLVAWVAQEPKKRAHRGCQKRLLFAEPITECGS